MSGTLEKSVIPASTPSAPPMARVAYLPESAPFNPEQRAWLNGFLAAWFIQQGLQPSAVATEPSAPAKPLLILYGSQSGNSEMLARKFGNAAPQHRFESRVVSMEQYASLDLAAESTLLLVVSTWGDGEVPDNAKAFWACLNGPQAPRLDHLRFAVLALGDTNYESTFCQAGKNFDRRLEELGAKRLADRMDCTTNFEPTAKLWIESVWRALAGQGEGHGAVEGRTLTQPAAPLSHPMGEGRGEGLPRLGASNPAENDLDANGRRTVASTSSAPSRPRGPNGFNRSHPFRARLMKNRCLTRSGSNKDTRHLEISLADSGLAYEVGDALGVWPQNDLALVDRILEKLGCTGEEEVNAPEGGATSLRRALLEQYEVNKLTVALLEAAAARCPAAGLDRLLAADRTGALEEYVWGRDVLDLLCDFPALRLAPAEFTKLLRQLTPRLYSIASSPKAHPGEVHLTVGPVRFESHGRARGGVCSTFLADRCGAAAALPVFVQSAPGFRLPADPAAPVIMVGPGTGIAPFRAFLEERAATGASGRNWLFFGEQKSATDFLYREEFETWCEKKHLTRCDTAFSRDQAEKVYVQHRLLERAPEVWRWLEDGAYFYVCGDARRMAKDVEAALHAVAEQAGGLSRDAAADYVRNLKTQKRYQRDVY